MSDSDFSRTANYNLYKPTIDADDDQWGVHWNWNADAIDAALHENAGGGGPGKFLPLTGGDVTGPTTFTPPPLLTDASGHTAPPGLVFPTVAAMLAFDFTVAMSPFGVSCQGYYAAGDGGGGDFSFLASIGKPASAQVTAGAVLQFSDTSGLAAGMAITGTGIPPHTFLNAIVANSSVTMSKSVNGTVAVGATISFLAGDSDGAFILACKGGVLRRQTQGRSITLEQCGLKADYILPLPYLASATTAAGSTVIPIASTTGIQVGWWAHHPAIPFGTTVASLTTNSVTLSAPTTAGLTNADYVCFNPVATDNTFLWNNVTNLSNLVGIEYVVPNGKFFYFGPGTTSDMPKMPAFSMIRGQSPAWNVGRGQAASGVMSFTSGIVLHPACYFKEVGIISKLRDLTVVRAGLPGNPPNLTTYMKYLDQWNSENGVLANPLTIPTSANSSGSVLNFADTTGVTVGMGVLGGPNIVWARVAGVTATTVTLNTNIASTLPAGTVISFGSNFRSIGIWVCIAKVELEHVYVLGFNTGVMATAGGFKMHHVISDSANGFDLSGSGEGLNNSNLRAAADWTFGLSGTVTWNVCSAVALASGGSGYKITDLLLDELNNLVPVASIDANGGVTSLGPLLWRGGCYRAVPASTATMCQTSDPQGSYGYGGGTGVGCRLTPTALAVAGVNYNYVPGRGFYLHERLDGVTFRDCLSTGHHYEWIISNVWVLLFNSGGEGRMGAGLGGETIGIWTWNTAYQTILHDCYAAGQDTPMLLQHVDAVYATIKPKMGGGAFGYVGVFQGNIVGANPRPAITLGPHSRGMLDGVNVLGHGPNPTDAVVSVQANVEDWKILNMAVPTEVYASQVDWIRIDPTSLSRVSVENCRPIGFANQFYDSDYPQFLGPGDRSTWPKHIAFDPSSLTPTDGSPTSPMTLQSLEAGGGTSANLLLARGGTQTNPGRVGLLGTSNRGIVLDATTTTQLVTTASVPAGGSGYWGADRIVDYPTGGVWSVATTDAVGQVLTVNNVTPGAYTGAAPSNPVTTWTAATGGSGGSLVATVTAGAVSLTGSPTGAHYYAANTRIEIGVPGTYAAGVLLAANPAGVQATATPIVSAGVITGVTMTNAGSGYTGAPAVRVVNIPPAGCTLNLGAGAMPNGLDLNPSGGPVTVRGAPVTFNQALYASYTNVGNGADTTIDTLQTFTMAAGQLKNVGDRLLVRAGGTLAATTDNKTVRLTFGAATPFTAAASTAGQIYWRIEGEICKTGPNAQTYSGFTMLSNNSSGAITLTTSQTDTNALTLAITGQNTTNPAANSITCRYFTVDYIAA